MFTGAAANMCNWLLALVRAYGCKSAPLEEQTFMKFGI